MRFRLLRRRLTVSSPRMAVRSALPWPFRWAVLAIVLGFCAAIGLWAFEFGKDIAGLDNGSKAELVLLRGEVASLKSQLLQAIVDRDAAQSIANTADTLVTAEKASRDMLVAQAKQLETENNSLRDDLGFFEKLIPAASVDGLAIRGLQAEVTIPGTLKWQALVMQPGRNTQEFNGRLEVTFAGTVNGRPWSGTLPTGPLPIKIKQYGRMAGDFSLPEGVVVKSVTAQVLEGVKVRAAQTIKL